MPVEMSESAGGLPMAIVSNKATGASVRVHLQGAHVEGWTTAQNERPLYMSPATEYKEGKPLRGGVPVCWPQFSDFGPCKAMHGFARNNMWDVEGCDDEDQNTILRLALRSVSGADVPAPFDALKLKFSVALVGADRLKMELLVTNPTDAAVEFTTALHTYFAVSEISGVRIEGVLDTVPYADSLEQRVEKPAAEIRVIDKEVDRIYKGTDGKEVRIINGQTGAVTTITAANLNDTILWNPWIEKAKRLADLPDEDYHKFVCVESAAVYNKATVAPGATWTGSQLIRYQGELGLSASSAKI